MVYRFLIKIVLTIFFSLNTFAVVLYDKNELIITDIELNIYKDLYLKNYKYEIQDSNGLKDLVLLNNVIKDLKKNNIEFINKIDKEIISMFGENIVNNEIVLNFYRFSKVRDEFIYNYFRNNLNVDEIANIFKDLKVLNLPISENNCLVIKDVVDLKNNREFIESFFYNLKNNTNDYKAKIRNLFFNVCIDENSYYKIEQLIVSYIRIQTEKEFENFIYEKTKN
jgi:hypothetical protein|tara:strand:+ start:371 stop:1042 length:672 start_codon:yes stop_codon:yes gene_type:complete